MAILHMEPEVVRRVLTRLRLVLEQMREATNAVQRLPHPSSWWTGGWAASRFEHELHLLQTRLSRLTEEGWRLVHLLEQELREWEAAAAHLDAPAPGVAITGLLAGVGAAVAAGVQALIGTFAHGLQQALAWVSDPVDVRVGYYVEERVDLTLPPGPPFEIKRAYTSHPQRPGWRFLLPLRITYPAPERVRLLLDTEGILSLEFRKTSEGWESPGPGYVLEETDAGLRFRVPQGMVFEFDHEGRLCRWQDAQGREVSFKQAGERIWHILAPWGARWAEIHLDDRGRILQVTDEEGRLSRYTYDDQGRLVAFTDRNGQTTRYTYNAHGWLQRIIAPSGGVTPTIKRATSLPQRTARAAPSASNMMRLTARFVSTTPKAASR